MKISTSYVCVNCEALSENPRQCQYCLSIQVHRLDDWLNRKTARLQANLGQVKPFLVARPHKSIPRPEMSDKEILKLFTNMLADEHAFDCTCVQCAKERADKCLPIQ